MKFYDREKELDVLEKANRRPGADFIIINGRRRVGKSRLIEEFLRDKKALNVLIVPKEEKQVAKDFEEEIRSKFGYSPSFDSFKGVMEYVFEHIGGIVCMDEFSNILHVNKSIQFELQRLWDKNRGKDVLLVLSGSYVGMMKKLFAAKRAPLFNRATNTINLPQLSFKTVVEILSDLGVSNPIEQVSFYCIFGGVPYYYILLEREKKIEIAAVVNSLFFDAGAQLKEEGENVLRQEFGNAYSKYYSILEAVSFGFVSLGEISQKLGVNSATMAKYLNSLQKDFSVLERTVPFGQNLAKSKKGFYFVKDNMIAFWFSHVYGKRNFPSKEEFNAFIGKRFEMLCMAFFILWVESKNEKVLRAGKWWGAVEVKPKKFEQRELDVVVETDKNFYIGECKWSENKIGESELKYLKQSALQIASKTKKPIKWVLFSKNGFTISETSEVLLFTPLRITKEL